LVIRELQTLCRDVEIIISTGVDPKTIARFLPQPFSYRSKHYEPGTIQKNSFELDPAATRSRYRTLFQERAQDLSAETEFLKQTGCRGLVSDIPALPIKAAADLGIPTVGLSNFTWDWILQPIFAGESSNEIPGQLTTEYASGDLHLKLPFGPADSPFRVSEPVPLVARTATQPALSVRKLLSLPEQGSPTLVVVCPGGWDPEGWQRISVQNDDGRFFYVFVGDLPIDCTGPHLHLPHELMPGLSFPDLVNGADMVLAKPGYGIASECLLHQTPAVFIERPDFRETPLLVEEFSKGGRCAEVSLADFFAGRWTASIERVLLDTSPWRIPPRNGAQLVAERLASFFGW
jgi:L-arabinokinase